MSKTARRVVAADGTPGSLTPETITDYGIKRGVFRQADRAAVLARAQANPSAVLTAVCRATAAAGPVTPATPATRPSGPAVAAGSAPTGYPLGFARSVAAARRTSGLRVGAAKERAASVARAAFRTRADVAASNVVGGGFYDKAPQASEFAAAQQAAREADQQRMAAEQAARFGA